MNVTVKLQFVKDHRTQCQYDEASDGKRKIGTVYIKHEVVQQLGAPSVIEVEIRPVA